MAEWFAVFALEYEEMETGKPVEPNREQTPDEMYRAFKSMFRDRMEKPN